MKNSMRAKFLSTLVCAAAFTLPSQALADEPKGDSGASGQKTKEKKDGLADRAISGKARRVAIMHYGPPLSWNGEVGEMVGITISAKALRDAIPLLEQDKVDVVVMDVNSGGGYSHEMDRLQDVLDNEYEKKFRTVAWIHWAGSAAAMSPWVLNEIYFRPGAAYGGNVQFSGGRATTGLALEFRMASMEEASRRGGRDFRIMRSMQGFHALSATRKGDGTIEFFQDYTSGEIKINPPNQVLTLQALQAVQIGVAAGIAATREELMERMGITEYEWAGEKAIKFYDDFMRKAHKTEKYTVEQAVKYRDALGTARRLAGPENKQARGQELGIAKRTLAEIKKAVNTNDNFSFHLAGYFNVAELTPAWFADQERIIKELSRD